MKKDTIRKDFLQNAKDCLASFPEVVVRWFSVKEMLLRISQNSQRIPYWSLFSIKLTKEVKRTLQGDCLVFHYFKSFFISIQYSYCS